MSNSQSAARLFLSQKTVCNYVYSVLNKLQTADRAEAIIRA
ncbi:response regulator transcription factor [Acrocarpospora macrocephala]